MSSNLPTDKKYPPRRISKGDTYYTSSNARNERRSPEAISPNSQRYRTTHYGNTDNTDGTYRSYQSNVDGGETDQSYRKSYTTGSSGNEYNTSSASNSGAQRETYSDVPGRNRPGTSGYVSRGQAQSHGQGNITSNESNQTNIDRRLSNSIARPKSELDKLNHSSDSLINTSFDRKLSNSIAIPGLFDDDMKNQETRSKTKQQHRHKLKSPKLSPKQSKKTIDSNLDTTGEKARLLSVRRLDTPDEPRRYPDTESSDSSSMMSDNPETPDVFLPKRYILAIMMFLGFVNMYAIRVNLNVAIGAMVNNHTLIKGGVASVEPPEFDWSSRLQGVVLGSFYYGYMVLQVPGGYCAMKYGGTKIFGGAILVASLLTVLTPVLTRFSVWALIILRVLEGLALGVMLPCNHQIWSLWAPHQERTILVTIALAGMNVGTVVTMPLTGLLTKYGFDGGWASVFYCFGVFGVIWSLLWFAVVHATPDSHPTITTKERKYIVKNVIATKKMMKIPWRAIFTSRPVWAIIIGNIANDWGLYTILICLPLFLMDIMKFNVQTMGFVASLPFLLKAIVGPIGGVISDILRYKYMTTANARRLFYFLGAMSAAVMIVIAGYSQTPTVAVLSMCIGVAMSGLLHSGYEVNVLDIAPCLSGIVMGISNTAGTTTGFLSPLLVGFMTENKKRSEWILVFWITFFIYLIGTILFCWMLSGEPQHWAIQDDENDEDENDEKLSRRRP